MPPGIQLESTGMLFFEFWDDLETPIKLHFIEILGAMPPCPHQKKIRPYWGILKESWCLTTPFIRPWGSLRFAWSQASFIFRVTAWRGSCSKPPVFKLANWQGRFCLPWVQLHPGKLTIENQASEDVSPDRNGDFPLSCSYWKWRFLRQCECFQWGFYLFWQHKTETLWDSPAVVWHHKNHVLNASPADSRPLARLKRDDESEDWPSEPPKKTTGSLTFHGKCWLF